MVATTPELGPVCFRSPKSSSFSSIVVEEVRRSYKKLLKSTAEYKQVAQSEFLIQHDKVEASKFRRYLQTCGCAWNSFYKDKCPPTTPLSS